MTDFSNKALGKLPPLPDRPALMLADVLTGVVPAIPVQADRIGAVPDWELGANDRYGTCGPTSVANNLRMVSLYLTGQLDAVTLEDVFDLYRRSGNPNFNPSDPWDDNGVYMHIMLEALLEDGIGGRRPIAFAKIAAGDTDTLNKAIAIFGGALLGLSLQTAQQRQTVWDYTPGSGQWGGHAVFAGRYNDPTGTDQDRVGIVTWGEVLDTTRGFIDNIEDEAWVVIWPHHLGSASFLEGVNVEALASAYQDLTGHSFPVIEPTPQPVDPSPTDAGEALAVALQKFLRRKGIPNYLRDAADDWLVLRD